jgi:uncharacterized DUF497 family protein
MKVIFDPAKDDANRLKHGISLARAEDMDFKLVVEDDSTTASNDIGHSDLWTAWPTA